MENTKNNTTLEREDYKTVVRSVSMPNWLYKKATANNISLSAVLQKALIEILGTKKSEN